jgi:hypothetical protein
MSMVLADIIRTVTFKPEAQPTRSVLGNYRDRSIFIVVVLRSSFVHSCPKRKPNNE